MGLLFVSTQPIHAQESPAFEKIRDVSPDGKFALRISCSSEPEDPDNIDSSLITAADLVSLPSKKVVVNVMEEGTPPHLIWSPDSKWVAFPVSESHRVTDTRVYHRSGEEFTQLETENLRVNAKGAVRNEYVNPVRWIKPGILLLEHSTSFAVGTAKTLLINSPRNLTRTRKFQIGSKKKVPSKE
ncbi:MAG TPA: hypothetical protein VIS53_01280 [Candidatus Udaeobacter sp.]